MRKYSSERVGGWNFGGGGGGGAAADVWDDNMDEEEDNKVGSVNPVVELRASEPVVVVSGANDLKGPGPR